MKTFLSLLSVFLLIACNQKSEEVRTPEMTTAAEPVEEKSQETLAEVYTCSMHPEVTGKQGDKCPKCEMDLVKQTPESNQ